MSLIRADARALPIASGVVQCCVTSPPYWGLRDYGTAGQLGLEQTPDAYVDAMVDVFRQVHRVLRNDGVLFLNLGDSYCSTAPGTTNAPQPKGSRTNAAQWANVRPETPIGLKPKDLVGIPWRVAFALQADGWYLRSDIIWSKPNPMPESVTDRPTKSHEYVFLLTKSERYYWDAAAIREAYAPSTLREAKSGYLGTARKEYAAAGVQDPSDTKRRIVESLRRRQGMVSGAGEQVGANARTVWSIATQPYAGAHFATMPEKLAERCILAGSKPGDLVLDPFLGSGTVARCAISLGRRAVGTDLNRAYLTLADERMHVTRGLPLEVA